MHEKVILMKSGSTIYSEGVPLRQI